MKSSTKQNYKYKIMDKKKFKDTLINAGTPKEISNKTGISINTVKKWFNGSAPYSKYIKTLLKCYPKYKLKDWGVKKIVDDINEDNLIFAKILQELMDRNNLERQDLMKRFGLSKSTVSEYLSGTNVPRLIKATEIANYFHVSVNYLLTGEILEDDTIAKTGLTNKTINKCETYKKNSAPTGLFDMVSKINEINTVNYIIGQTDFVEKFTKQTEEYKKVEKEYKETNKRNGGKILPVVKDKRNGDIETIKNNIEKEIACILEEYVKTIPDEYRELTKK